MLKPLRQTNCGNTVEQTSKKCGQNHFLYTLFVQETTPQNGSVNLIHRSVPGLSSTFPLAKQAFFNLLNRQLSTLSTTPITITI